MKNYSVKFNENKSKMNIIFNTVDIFAEMAKGKRSITVCLASIIINICIYLLNIEPKLWVLVLSSEYFILQITLRLTKKAII